MKWLKSNISLGLFIVIVALFMVFISLGMIRKDTFKLTAEEVHSELLTEELFMHPDELLKILEGDESGFTLIDVRSQNDFENGRIEMAVNIPMSRLLDEASRVLYDQSKLIVLYDQGVEASVKSCVILRQMGFDNVFVLHGGFNYWNAKVLKRNVFADIPLDDELPRHKFKAEKDSI